jgi:ribosomal protein S18 acetylase RimI-like enzyme
MTGLVDAQGRPYTPAEVGLDGAMDLLILLCGNEPVGVMSCEVREDDAQLFFCHLRESYEACEGQFFTMAVDHFRSAGMQVVRTNFLWPSPERCIEAARALSFTMLERIEMARESDRTYPARPVPEGVELLPWSDGWLDGAARLLSENGNEIDRQIYPQEQTFPGALSQLKKIAGGTYGDFLPGQSVVARANGRLVGMLLATEYGRDSLLIPQVIVEKGFRGKGIAGAMIGRLIRDSAARGPRKITLMVNAYNEAALRLYERAGFRPTFVFRQYILAGRPGKYGTAGAARTNDG